jgi:cytochrome c553
MKKVLTVVTGLAVAAALATGLGLTRADEKEPTIKEIMTKAHKGGDSIIEHLKKDLKEKDPDWAEIKTHGKELVDLGASLGKATPKKGDKASWEKLTKTYVDNAKALEAAADKKDSKASSASLQKLSTSCGGCHRVHK